MKVEEDTMIVTPQERALFVIRRGYAHPRYYDRGLKLCTPIHQRPMLGLEDVGEREIVQLVYFTDELYVQQGDVLRPIPLGQEAEVGWRRWQEHGVTFVGREEQGR